MKLVKYIKTATYCEHLLGRVFYLDPASGCLSEQKDPWKQVASGYKPMYGPYWGNGTCELEDIDWVQDGQAYPDGNPKSLQGAKKYSLRYLPLSANIAVNQALEDGAKKYGPANWREKGVAISVYVDAALRHLNQFYDGGQDNAADSGAPNLGHAMACLAIIIDAMAEGSAIDDRPFPAKDTDALLKRPGV